MASSSGTSATSLSDEDVKARQEQRKRRRMDSNRESARRSRMRKRKQVEDLTAEASRLKSARNTSLMSLTTVNQHYMAIEAENCVLRTQHAELSNRLHALNEIITFMSGINSTANPNWFYTGLNGSGFDVNPWSVSGSVNLHPLMASADLSHCC